MPYMETLRMEDVRLFEPFRNLPEEALDWLLEKSTLVELKTGEYLFKKDEPADDMIMVLEGKIQFSAENNGQLLPVGMINKGDISGLLPYSRLKTTKGYATVLEDVRVLLLHKSHFREMGDVSYKMVQNLVGLMSDRVRNFTRVQQQQEKMAALGQLSAGLAHELNNPTSAMVRSAKELKKRLGHKVKNFKRVVQIRLNEEQIDYVNDILFTRIDNMFQDRLSLTEKTELEDDLVDWLEDHDVEEAFMIAENLAEARVTTDDLDKMHEKVGAEYLEPVVAWLDNSIQTERLVVEIEEASNRIYDLVSSIKTYSHMDKAPTMEPTEIGPGIHSTVSMLGYKVKKKNIDLKITIADALPKVNAYVSELNQVWTNLIDNAIDAVGKEGTIEIVAEKEGKFVKVDVIDNGHGIPEDILPKIFDPFFTTKEVGKGSGLGLDVVMRIIKNHNADITVRSEPGRTIFQVCFPMIKQA